MRFEIIWWLFDQLSLYKKLLLYTEWINSDLIIIIYINANYTDSILSSNLHLTNLAFITEVSF